MIWAPVLGLIKNWIIYSSAYWVWKLIVAALGSPNLNESQSIVGRDICPSAVVPTEPGRCCWRFAFFFVLVYWFTEAEFVDTAATSCSFFFWRYYPLCLSSAHAWTLGFFIRRPLGCGIRRPVFDTTFRLQASIYYGLGFFDPILQLLRRNVCISFLDTYISLASDYALSPCSFSKACLLSIRISESKVTWPYPRVQRKSTGGTRASVPEIFCASNTRITMARR